MGAIFVKKYKKANWDIGPRFIIFNLFLLLELFLNILFYAPLAGLSWKTKYIGPRN